MIRRLLRRLRPLEPPRNVRVLCEDGEVVPVEVVYVGREKGIDCWQTPYAILYREGMQMLYDYMPYKSYVHVWFRAPDEYEWEDA